MDSPATKKAKQEARVEKIDQLTDLFINDLVTVAKSGAMTSADRKIIMDLLNRNGLDLDPNKVGEELGDIMTSRPKFPSADDSDEPKRKLSLG